MVKWSKNQTKLNATSPVLWPNRPVWSRLNIDNLNAKITSKGKTNSRNLTSKGKGKVMVFFFFFFFFFQVFKGT